MLGISLPSPHHRGQGLARNLFINLFFFFAFLDILDKSALSHFPKTMLRACITPNHYASFNVFLSSLTLNEYECN